MPWIYTSLEQLRTWKDEVSLLGWYDYTCCHQSPNRFRRRLLAVSLNTYSILTTKNDYVPEFLLWLLVTFPTGPVPLHVLAGHYNTWSVRCAVSADWTTAFMVRWLMPGTGLKMWKNSSNAMSASSSGPGSTLWNQLNPTPHQCSGPKPGESRAGLQVASLSRLGPLLRSTSYLTD